MNSGQINAVNTRQGLGGATEGRLGFARVYKGRTSGIRAEYKRSTSDYLQTLSIPPVSKYRASPRCPRHWKAGGDCGRSEVAGSPKLIWPAVWRSKEVWRTVGC
jgi:hypothetical protein